jgi:hypothetical protein
MILDLGSKLTVCYSSFQLHSFSRETPNRFKKEMIKAVECNDNGLIKIDSLNRILMNIGRSDQLLSEDELVTLLHDAGSTERTISATTLLELV